LPLKVPTLVCTSESTTFKCHKKRAVYCCWK